MSEEEVRFAALPSDEEMVKVGEIPEVQNFFRSKLPEIKERKLSVEPLFVIDDSVAEVLDVNAEVRASIEPDLLSPECEPKEQSVEEALQNLEILPVKKVRWEDDSDQKSSDYIPPMQDTIFSNLQNNKIQQGEDAATDIPQTTDRSQSSLGELISRIDKVLDQLNVLEIGKQIVINHNHYYVSPSK